jgi:murein DD-endopeptidase MepM/ murein hydrolase activator NlpD
MVARSSLLRFGFFLFSIFCGLVLSLTFARVSPSYAQTSGTSTSTLQAQIDQTNTQIKSLQDQIAALQSQLTTTTAQKQTLQNAINALNLQIQKLQKSITLAQTQIKQKDAQISVISTTISTTTTQIGQAQLEVAGSLRELDSLDNESLLVALLSGSTLSSFFDQAAALAAVRSDLENKIQDLNTLKGTLKTNETAAEAQKQQLAAYQQTLTQQQQGLAIAKDSQTKLLTQTKNKESAYQTQIAEKQKEEAQFESDLLDFQSKLNLNFSASSLPATGQGALQWPLKGVYGSACPAPKGYISCVTQYFGNTDFATANPQIYSGHGHSGLDLAASPGTQVYAAREGVVLGTGNTDLTCPGASFGKWIFIKHDNGLSTLYGHLASFTVAKGDIVTTGQLIAYSDTTGYATGPHLHFGVYASAGSEIASFASSGCKGKTYTMPVADLSAYLNPLSYLPPVPGK